jgi:hypothetical protein
MAGNVHSVARNWFVWAHRDAKNTNAIKKAFNDCMSGSLGKGGMDSVTSAAKNGISMQKTVGMSESERMDALRIAIQWLDQGFVTSNRSLGRF